VGLVAEAIDKLPTDQSDLISEIGHAVIFSSVE
jgi:hypothetical protein